MNSIQNIKSRNGLQSGFSLLEVMIAVAVLAIGLVGLARLQAAGLMNNQHAYQLSQATVLAYDLADRMRTNFGAINNYQTSRTTLAQAAEAGAQEGCTSTSGCSAAQMALNDLYEWRQALTATLPSPTGIITQAGGTFTIAINWDANRDGSVDTADVNFQMSFVP